MREGIGLPINAKLQPLSASTDKNPQKIIIDNIKLVYNNVTRKTTNQPGVDVRVPGFGDPLRVEWLDPSQFYVGAYFKYIGNSLVNIGYERNLTIMGAPFDFRRGPTENKEYFANLKTLVEETYMKNNEKVVLVAHSMGGPMCIVFLQMMSQSWKDKYIRALVSLSGAYGGSVKALKVYLVGDDLGSYGLSSHTMREMQITSPSLAWLMPNPLFWSKDEILVQTVSKNYSLSNIKDFFVDIDYVAGWEMMKDQKPFTDFRAPGVEIHCLHGYGVDTVERLSYNKKSYFPDKPNYIYGDGDGTVNKKSLESCLYWKGKQKQNVYHETFKGVDHMQILSDKNVLTYITSLMKKLS